MICHYWYFKDISYKFQSFVCNRCYDISMMIYDVKDFYILDIKSVNYRCIVCNMSRNTAIEMLNNS